MRLRDMKIYVAHYCRCAALGNFVSYLFRNGRTVFKHEVAIVFTGENIKLENYLDGYDPALMTIDSLEKRDVGTYTATITLKDRFNST